MNGQNNPVDISQEQIGRHKSSIEDMLAGYQYRSQTNALHELIQGLDPSEKYVMSDVERDTYKAIRDGFQIFKAINELVYDKAGLKQKLIEAKDIENDPELNAVRDFCHNFSTYAMSAYISKKLDATLKEAGYEEPKEKTDLSAIEMDNIKPENAVIRKLLVPIYSSLMDHRKSGAVFSSPADFTHYIKEVFDKYKEITIRNKGAHPEMLRHIDGYDFRIMDDFIVLDGYQDKSKTIITPSVQAVSFRPIKAEEIAGNRNAKRQLTRDVHRLLLYDPIEQMNPILELGGLPWTTQFDGVPGTGKSSLFRYMMTLISEMAPQMGFNYNFISIDQSIKDEYYGKTGKILLQRYEALKDPNVLGLVIYDDLDLLTSARNDAQGADNDINSIIMQYLDGAFTIRRGNVINFAATNKPTGLDNAIRNRMNRRVLIDGPVTAEDFADIFHIMGGKLLKKGLIQMEEGYTPFATQAVVVGKNPSGEDVAAYLADEFIKYKNAKVIDFGRFMAEKKKQNNFISGRSANAIMESVKERCADFDVPLDWFNKRPEYVEKPYPDKINMVGELYQKISPDVIFQEAQRYFDSEQRFLETESLDKVSSGYNNMLWTLQSELNFMQDQIAQGDNSLLVKRDLLNRALKELGAKNMAIVAKALENAQNETRV